MSQGHLKASADARGSSWKAAGKVCTGCTEPVRGSLDVQEGLTGACPVSPQWGVSDEPIEAI